MIGVKVSRISQCPIKTKAARLRRISALKKGWRATINFNQLHYYGPSLRCPWQILIASEQYQLN
jgi:hypothetical protein